MADIENPNTRLVNVAISVVVIFMTNAFVYKQQIKKQQYTAVLAFSLKNCLQAKHIIRSYSPILAFYSLDNTVGNIALVESFVEYASIFV